MASKDAINLEDLVFAEGQTIGAGLKAAREHLGLTLEDVSDDTKVRPHYLTAIEDMQLAKLPSRPFVEGYLRAYVRLLGVDETRAITRMRQDWPLLNEALPEPMGMSEGADPRIAVIATAGALVLLAIVVWNVAQRAMAEREPIPTAAIAQAPPKSALPAAGTPVELGLPLPPPVEATLPPAYVTPGLEPEGPPEAAPAGSLIASPAEETIRYFQPKGKIYGAAAEQSVVTLQAVNAVFVILRKGDTVMQIQELKAGESYRAPIEGGLAIDVTAPSALEVYVSGQYRGRLLQSLNQISSLSR